MTVLGGWTQLAASPKRLETLQPQFPTEVRT
jgi:hypothetical protein